MSRLSFTAIAITLLTSIGWWLDGQSRPPIDHTRPIVDSNVVYASGRIEGATRDVQLRFEIPGRIVEICADEGDFVEADDLLMRLDSTYQEQQVALRRAELELANGQLARLKNGAHPQERREAEAILEARQADLRNARQTLQRAMQLHSGVQGTIAEQQLDNHRTDVDRAAQQVAAAKARLDLLNAPARADELQIAEAKCRAAEAQWKLAQTELAKTRLVAPNAGIVARISHEPGELTGPDIVEPAVLMVDNRQLRVRVYIEEQDTHKVCLGQTATIHTELNADATLEGVIAALSPRMSAKQSWSEKPGERLDLKTREILVDLDSIDGLILGQSVDVEIHTAAEQQAAENTRTAKHDAIPTQLLH